MMFLHEAQSIRHELSYNLLVSAQKCAFYEDQLTHTNV